MNLYMTYPNEKYENDEVYDIFNSAIVAAHSLNDAKKVHPSGSNNEINEKDKSGTWPTSISHISATLIGKAKEGTKRGVILASFNAG